MARVAEESADVSGEVIEFIDKAVNSADPSDANWSDNFFGELWDSFDTSAMASNDLAHAHLSLLQIMRNVTDHIMREPQWREVPKGAHFYNMGRVYIANRRPEMAFRYFLLADREDAEHKGTEPGDLFRAEELFSELRRSFFKTWLESEQLKLSNDVNLADRLGLVERLILDIPGRHLVSRCHLGLFRMCQLFLDRRHGLPTVGPEYLLALEEMVVLAESAAKRLSFDDPTANETFGCMMEGNQPVGDLGFMSTDKFRFENESETRRKVDLAREGNRGYMSRVVMDFRNKSAHADRLPEWCIDEDLLWDVLVVILDFTIVIAGATEEREQKPTAGSNASGAHQRFLGHSCG